MAEEKTYVHFQAGSGAFLLFLVFLVLKLTKVITWSWWWVTAPLWAGYALGIVLLAVGLTAAVLVHRRAENNIGNLPGQYGKSLNSKI